MGRGREERPLKSLSAASLPLRTPPFSIRDLSFIPSLFSLRFLLPLPRLLSPDSSLSFSHDGIRNNRIRPVIVLLRISGRAQRLLRMMQLNDNSLTALGTITPFQFTTEFSSLCSQTLQNLPCDTHTPPGRQSNRLL